MVSAVPIVINKRGVGRPSRAAAARIEDQILDSARRAFCRNGFAGTSMEAIAEECRLTKHTIYRRYPGKSALLDAVIARDLARITDPLPDCSAGNPLLALKAAGRRIYDFSILPENVAFFSFVESEAIYSNEVKCWLKDWTSLAIAPIIAAVETAQAAGLFEGKTPTIVAETLLDLIDGPCRRMQLGRSDVFHGETACGFFERRWQNFLVLARA